MISFQCCVCGKRYNGKKSVNRHLQKRHGVLLTDDAYSSSFHQLDPRQCSLGLDEDTLLRIFGPEKNVKPLPFQVTSLGTLKIKIKTPQPYAPSNNEDSDGDYRPTQKIKTESLDHSTDEADVPISGLDLASLKTRVKRETSRNVTYDFDSADDDIPFGKMTKKKGKIKFKRKLKLKSLHLQQSQENRSDEDCEEELPLFPLVEIKSEPVDYD